MGRLPSVNQLIAEATAQVKTAHVQAKTASEAPQVYTTPIASELQKVAAACRNGAMVTVEDVTKFAQRLQEGTNV